MTKEEFKKISGTNRFQIHVSVSELQNKEDRTLIYGYDIERNSKHIYLLDGKINTVIYNNQDKIIESFARDERTIARLCIPNKRCYSESCDYEFVKLLCEKGFREELCLLAYNEERAKRLENQKFHGKLISELGE